MPQDSEDSFSPVHAMMREGLFYQVIDRLVNSQTGRLKKDFIWDRNHAWYCVADSQFRMGNMKEAIRAFKKAYKAAPSDVECLLAIGNCFDALKQPKMVERYLRQALALNPTGRKKAAVLVNLGNSLLDQHRWSEAVECFMKPSKRSDGIGFIARKNRMIARERLKVISKDS